MSPFSIELAHPSDFEAILALQTRNHLTQLPEEQLADGFVTTWLTPEFLEAQRNNQGIWVARSESGELAAYACANDWPFYGTGPFQSTALALLPFDLDGRAVTSENSFQYGPVCIAAEYRGRGVLPAIVQTVKAHMAPNFEFGITFIDVRNARSLAAHERKLGYRRMARLPFETVTYNVLAFETRTQECD